MILVPEGPFVMGSDDGNFDEMPRREVHVDSFYIDEYLVTNQDYKIFVEEAGHRAPLLDLPWSKKYDWSNGTFPKGTGNWPVVIVDWHDAMAYCEWAGKRLPTEAEWEKAARGSDRRIWPWGNDWDPKRLACSGVGHPQPVGTYPDGKSPFGCFDMAGNVWEWTSDWYNNRYYGIAPSRNPKGPDSGEERVLKGGAWIHSGFSVRCAMRFHKPPEYCDNYIGFRCAKSER